MRKLRVVFTTMGAVPALAVALLPAMEACGSVEPGVIADGSTNDASSETNTDDVELFPPQDAVADVPLEAPPSKCGGWGDVTYTVVVPPPGVIADPGQICSVVQPPVTSNTSARITLTSYVPQTDTASGFVAVPAPLLATIVGLPVVTVASGSQPELSTLTITNMTKAGNGFTFDAKWPSAIPHSQSGYVRMVLKATFTIDCGDGATQIVESITKLDMCVDVGGYVWVSSGDACTVCAVIAEMAPSPIVSDNQGDDLPLGRVIRIRVVEVARAGRQVLLFAENDGGETTEYEWRMSGGTFESIANDVVLWSMPEEGGAEPFGQVAVWNEEGAVVENFLFGAA
ncbi:hypothetical protein BH09MYX1_BH09MYX1_26240 [soil metagenome]